MRDEKKLVNKLKLSRYEEFARENLGAGILGGAGALLEVEIWPLI